jgi:hypothetical protein
MRQRASVPTASADSRRPDAIAVAASAMASALDEHAVE